MKILLIEDDPIFGEMLVQSLTNQRYIVDRALEGQMGWEYAQSSNYNLIVIDVGLPKLDGITLCQKLRAQGCSTPILLMTAKDASRDRIRGLDAGADDYLTKPIDLAEFQARVRALLRRGEVSPASVLSIGNLQLDPASCQVHYREKLLPLTPKEYSLLELLMRNQSRVFSRTDMIEYLWTFDDPPQEDSVKAHIKGLRQKLKAAGAIDWIENVYGLGYRLNPKQLNQASKVEVTSADSGEPLLSDALEQQFNEAREKLWYQYQDLMRERFSLLQQTAQALERGNLPLSLRLSAEQAAHKLAGVLGMFDLDEGTELARQIEEDLHGSQNLNAAQVKQLRSQIHQLEQLYSAAFQDSSSSPHAAEVKPREITEGLLPFSETVKILVVDDDPIFLSTLRPVLEPWGIEMTGLNAPSLFWETLERTSPDLLILDVQMFPIGGIELCQALRTETQWQGLPIVFLTAHQDRDTIQQVFAAGADDYVIKPVLGPELLTRITNRLERTRLLQTLSTKDPLTGLTNQPQSNQELEHQMQDCEKIGKPFSIGVLSLRELHQINIQYGHSMGNQILQRWGRLFQSKFIGSERVGYWGNGEFVVGMPGLKTQEASERLSDVLISLRQQVFTTLDQERFQVICDVGVAEFPTNGKTLHELYQAVHLHQIKI